MSKVEGMTLQEAYEIAQKREPVLYVDGYGKYLYKRIKEVGIRIDDDGCEHPFVTLLSASGRSVLSTHPLHVERAERIREEKDHGEE